MRIKAAVPKDLFPFPRSSWSSRDLRKWMRTHGLRWPTCRQAHEHALFMAFTVVCAYNGFHVVKQTVPEMERVLTANARHIMLAYNPLLEQLQRRRCWGASSSGSDVVAWHVKAAAAQITVDRIIEHGAACGRTYEKGFTDRRHGTFTDHLRSYVMFQGPHRHCAGRGCSKDDVPTASTRPAERAVRGLPR